MTGIMAAVSGSFQNIVYTTGLYGPSGADPAPIDSSGNSPITFSRTWIGYYVPTATASTNFSVTATWTSGYGDGTQYSVGYLWLGNTAKSGYNAGNANVTASDTTASTNISVVAGQYYPIRLQWDANLTSGSFFNGFFFQNYTTSGALSLSIAGVTTPILLYYNSLTNGF
jgi:hypothetical protein